MILQFITYLAYAGLLWSLFIGFLMIRQILNNKPQRWFFVPCIGFTLCLCWLLMVYT